MAEFKSKRFGQLRFRDLGRDFRLLQCFIDRLVFERRGRARSVTKVPKDLQNTPESIDCLLKRPSALLPILRRP